MPPRHKTIGLLILVLALFGGLVITQKSIAQSLEPPPPIFHAYFPTITYTIPPEWIGPDGGLISAVVFSRQDPAVMYAGSWGGGVYKSIDGGASWTRTNQGLGNMTVVSMAIDPSHPDVLYAGTYRGKIWKSSDAGSSWSLASDGIQDQAVVYSIVIDPQNTQRIYAATRGFSQNDRPWAGVVYRSDNGGASWGVSLANLGGVDYQDWVYALEIDPSRPNIIFGATHEHGPIRSKDYGNSWKVLTNGITNKSTRAIVVDPRPDYADYVYTGVWTKAGVFKSNDGGGTWELKNDGIAGANIYSMAINPWAPKTIFAATYNMGVMRTTNAANTWDSVGLKSDGIATVRVNPNNGQIVFSGTAGDGLYVSADGGSNWRPSQVNLKASDVSDLVVSTDDPTRYYAGLNGGGIMTSSDRGLSWVEFSPGLGYKFINGLVRQPGSNILFALSENGGIFRCNLDEPSTCWQKSGFNLTASVIPSPELNYPFANHASYLQAFGSESDPKITGPTATSAIGAPLILRFAPSNPSIAYLGTKDTGMFRSLDGGSNWTRTIWSGQTIWSLAIDPDDENVVYGAADIAGVIRRSINGGANWEEINIPGVIAYTLEAAPSGQHALWAGTGDGIYLYQDNQWHPSGLSGQTVISIAIYPGKPNLIFAGTTSGVWISNDRGSTWIPGPTDLKGVPIQSISFDPHEQDLIYYCTPAHGVLRDHIQARLLLP